MENGEYLNADRGLSRRAVVWPVVLLIVLFAFATTACQSNLAMKRIAAKNPLSKNSVKTPVQMVDVWKTYAQTTPEGKAMRGIAGRVHFYGDSKKKRTIKVDGDMSVFVFDGEVKDPAHAKPLCVYQFKSETLQKHYSFKKPLGHGYDFFLPVDEIDGEEKNLCVMTRFDDILEGSLVLSAPVHTILKGTQREATPETPVREFLAQRSILQNAGMEVSAEVQTGAASVDPGKIEQVAFRNTPPENTVGDSGTVRQRNVATISLNDHMTRRLTQAGAENETSTMESGRKIETDDREVDSGESYSAATSNEKRMTYPKTEYPRTPYLK